MSPRLDSLAWVMDKYAEIEKAHALCNEIEWIHSFAYLFVYLTTHDKIEKI